MLTDSYNPDVLSCIANLSSDEVFTPPKLANEMLNLLPDEIWRDSTMTFLDPFTKTGVYLREITQRLMEGLKTEFPDVQERADHILKNQVYGIAITELTGLLSRRTVYCSKKANGDYSVCSSFNDEQGNILYSKIEHSWENGRCIFCGANRSIYERDQGLETHAYQFIHTRKPEEIFNMKFDVIVGNPPYQLSDGSGKGAGAVPIYQKFIQQAKKMNPRFLVMIIPSRWFTGGRGLDEFRDEMINDTHIRILHDYLNASECFPGVEIKGGVCFFLRERDNKGLCEIYTHEGEKITSYAQRLLKEKNVNVFIRYNEAVPIIKKVMKDDFKSFSNIVSSAKPFGLRTYFQGKNKPFKNCIKIYANKNIGYISREEVKNNHAWIDQHKVIVPYAIGSGDSHVDLIKPLYAEPGSCCSETYLVIGPFSSKEIADNVISYMKTKFFHFFVTLKKHTQHATKGAYEFVPTPNFEESWDDEKLYQKFELTSEEISFIESLIRPME